MSSSRSHVACLAAAALLLQFSPAGAQPQALALPSPPPPIHRDPHPRPLVWGGATLFTLTYLASAVGATTAYPDDAGTASSRTLLWIPVVGPFVQMGSISGAGWDALLALDGLAQIAGLTLFTYGLTTAKSPPESAHSSGLTSPLRVSIAPFTAHGASGAVLLGTF